MTTLRETVQSVLDCWDSPVSEYAASDLFEELRAALEQPAEPVAWAVYDVKHGGSKTLHWAEQHSPHGDPEHFNAVPLYTHPPQQQAEPVALIRDGVLRWHIPHEHYARPGWTAHGTHMLYAQPPQRKPLTDAEIWEIHDACIPPTEGYVSPVEFARAIEQAHGIKETP